MNPIEATEGIERKFPNKPRAVCHEERLGERLTLALTFTCSVMYCSAAARTHAHTCTRTQCSSLLFPLNAFLLTHGMATGLWRGGSELTLSNSSLPLSQCSTAVPLCTCPDRPAESLSKFNMKRLHIRRHVLLLLLRLLSARAAPVSPEPRSHSGIKVTPRLLQASRANSSMSNERRLYAIIQPPSSQYHHLALQSLLLERRTIFTSLLHSGRLPSQPCEV